MQILEMLLGGYHSFAIRANQQFLLLDFNQASSVESGHIIQAVTEFYPLPRNAVLFTLPAEQAKTVISFNSPDPVLWVVVKSDGMTGTYIGAGLASHTMGIIHNRLSPEIFKRHVRFCGEPGGIGRRK
jgi:hypothetical protein